ncbi:hypothetical protein EON65_42205, partial [archaeon]
MASSGLFTKMDKKLTPLSHLDPLPPVHKKYVLIEESRLQNLLQFDAVLQREKHILQQQCASVYIDRHMPAHAPLPATRHAIHHLCEQEMSRARYEITKLNSAWQEHCKKNHYHDSSYPVYMRKSFVDIAPLAERALKLRLVKQARKEYLQRLDRDSMLYEDGLSFYNNIYHDALLRLKDYERYYILANRYGPMSEEEYFIDARPGKRYYTKVVKGAIKLQLLWDRYYAMAKLRRYRACRMVQKHWRRFIVYRKLHPIIKLRMKFGKRTYFYFCFALWKRYNHLCRTIREAIVYYRSNYVGICFGAWKKWANDIKTARHAKVRKMMIRSQNSGTYNSFHRWVKFLAQNKALKRKLKRYFGFPYFDLWLEHVGWVKHVKRLNIAAKRVQSHIRCFLARKKKEQLHEAYFNIRHFLFMVACIKKVKTKKHLTLTDEFCRWLPGELNRRHNKLNEEERMRLQRKHIYISDREKVEVRRLQEHLSTKDGNNMLKDLFEQYTRNPRNSIDNKYLVSIDASKLKGLSNKDKRKKIYDTLSYSMKKELTSMVRLLESHEYEIKSPAPFSCYHPLCTSTCTTEVQYHAHIGDEEAG